MEKRISRARFLGATLLAAAFMVLAAPSLARAQDVPDVSDEKLDTYTSLHVAVSAARDEFHQATARVHDEEARDRLREEVDETLDSLYQDYGMTQEEYDGITFILSINADLREKFEALLAEKTAAQANEADEEV